MRRLFVPDLHKSVSVLGFGCASLGSRISRRQGRRALDQAFEHGVTWYDVAPSYGDGEAETILGGFIAGKRDRVTICTKVGIAPPRISPAHRVARPLLRAILEIAPSVRRRISNARPRAVRAALTPNAIEASLFESLRRLRVDAVDVLMLHDPTVIEAADSGLWDRLHAIVDRGYARACGIAGSVDAVIAGRGCGSPFRIAQIADNPFQTGWDYAAKSGWNGLTVTHSVLSGCEALSQLERWMTENPEFTNQTLGPLYHRSAPKPSELLLDYALAKNTNGIVIASMYSSRHITANSERARLPPRADIIPILDGIPRSLASTAHV